MKLATEILPLLASGENPERLDELFGALKAIQAGWIDELLARDRKQTLPRLWEIRQDYVEAMKPFRASMNRRDLTVPEMRFLELMAVRTRNLLLKLLRAERALIAPEPWQDSNSQPTT